MSLFFWNIWGQGTFDLNFDVRGLANVNRHTTVVASITEISQPQGQALDFPFQGAATLRINNIVPLDPSPVAPSGSINVRVTIDWGSVLNARIYFAVFD
jgi:hypothetical protein